MVEGTRSLLNDAILSDPGWALQDPMKHPGSPKLRSGKSVPTPFLCGELGTGILFEEPNPTGSRPSDLIGLYKLFKRETEHLH